MICDLFRIQILKFRYYKGAFMKPQILLTMPIPEKPMEVLSSFADVELRPGTAPIDRDDLISRIKGKDALVSMLSDKIDKNVIDAENNLKVIGNYAVGYNNVDVAYANSKGIHVLNTPGVLTETTADLTWALMMVVARKIVEGDNFIRAGKFEGWAPTLMMGSDVYGKTLGIVGLGRIGQAVAKRAKGFSMKVLYHKRNRLDDKVEKELNAKYVDLKILLKESDYVVLLAPLTNETRHIINGERLSLMKESAFLINVGRGPLVDEVALVEFLKNYRLAGAGFDVYENEPELAPGLAELENVVVLPHIGSATVETRTKMGMLIVDGVKSVLEGQMPQNVVQI